jgi:serine/threonine protein kinase
VKCEVCGNTWPADQSICPRDGTWLHEQTIMEIKPRSRQERPTLPVPNHEFADIPLTDPRASIGFRTPSGRPLGDELEAGTRIGEYEVEAKVGEGATGSVYRAKHLGSDKHVALKVMSRKLFDEPDAVKRFVAEARALAATDHPSIVDVYGFGRIPDGRTYLVLEWLDGENLKQRLGKGPLPLEEACDIIRAVARALEAAHACGVVHRDLKPENVFLSRTSDDRAVIKLLDFGLAKTQHAEERLVARTRTGQMLGTPMYMSPEQCKAKGVDHRTDIYALGCMCYELLCGRVPFDADNVAELITSHLMVEPPRPSNLKPGLPEDLDKLLFNMVAKDPLKRPGVGEIRRIISMQVGRPTQPIAIIPLPKDVPAEPASVPAAPTEPPTPQRPASQAREITTDPVARVSSSSSTTITIAIAVAVVVVVVAVLIVLMM